MTDLVKVYNNDGPNSVLVRVPQCILNKLLNKEVVTLRHRKELRFREALLADIKAHPISKSNCFQFSGPEAKELIGEWAFIEENDWFILTEKTNETKN